MSFTGLGVWYHHRSAVAGFDIDHVYFLSDTTRLLQHLPITEPSPHLYRRLKISPVRRAAIQERYAVLSLRAESS